MERPTGVSVLAVLCFISAGLAILVSVAFMMGSAAISQMIGGGAGSAMFVGLGAIGGVFILGFAALYLIVGFGLWMLKSWGRLLMLILAAIGLIFGALGLLRALMHFHIMALVWQAIVCAIDLWIITYLQKPHVKQAFGA
jgi:uncharacterized membrane protein (DUF2068 family)